MSDSKYGRIFTESDVEKILEHLHDTYASSSPPPVLENVLGAMDENGVRFKFSEEEPTFILRARDKRAIGAIRYYRDHQSPRAPQNHLDGLDKSVDLFEKYRIECAGEMKEPD